MKEEMIMGNGGYCIPCVYNIAGGEEKIVILSHGFGSSKKGATADMIISALKKNNIRSIAFDFPAHGDSPAKGDKFRVGRCISDLAAVEAHVIKKAPKAKIMYFSSSFGAYINMLYMFLRPHRGRDFFLRCAAVDMAGIAGRVITKEELYALNKYGSVTAKKDFARPLEITLDLFMDLKKYNLFKLAKKRNENIFMIHGDKDETAPIKDALMFSGKVGAEFKIVKGAGHRFENPGEKEEVISAAIGFFKKN